MQSFCVIFIILQLISFFDAKPSRSTARMPANCVGQHYCPEPSEDYPHSDIEKVIRKLNLEISGGTTIENRDGGMMANVCESFEELQLIYEIIDKSGDVRFVAQQKDVFEQKYSISKCGYSGRVMEQKGIFTQDQVDMFNITCEDVPMKPKFLVLSHDKQKLEMVAPKEGVPMGCAVRYSELNEETKRK